MRYRLLQARLSDDPVRAEERASFALQLGVEVDDIEPFDLLSEDLHWERLVDGVDALLVGGSGAFSVTDDFEWVRGFIDGLGRAAYSGTPTFASCFGFQALVCALGGEVRHDEAAAEVGSFELERTDAADPLFDPLPPRFIAQQGHKDRAVRWPSGVSHLVRSARCEYQALRIDGQPVWATQFHPELTYLDNRHRFRRYLDMYVEAFGQSRAQRMLDDFQPSPEANALLRRFAALADPDGRAHQT